MTNKTFLFSLLVLPILFFLGCGKGSEIVIQDDSSGNSSTLVATVLLKVGDTECEAGGVQIDTGIDVNGNGVLDSDEIEQVKILCNGDTGFNSLLNISDEPKGNNCAGGGKRITSGIDENENKFLDESEILDTQYICNGVDGAEGKDGDKGDPGTNGEDGATVCTATDNEDGTKTLSCNDGSSFTISDGQDGQDGQDGDKGDPGTNGEDGISCSVIDNGDGTKTINCTDGSSVTIADGQDGDKGDPGTDGEDGTSCSVADNGDGTVTISCTDETSVTTVAGDPITEAIYCNGTLESMPDVYWRYEVKKFQSGNVLSTGEIESNYIEVSSTDVYSPLEGAYDRAPAVIAFDLLGPSGRGWWVIELNRETLVAAITYNV